MSLRLRCALAAVACVLAACVSPSLVNRGAYYADESHPARGADTRIRFLVMHYTEIDDTQSLRVLTEEDVSAHYLVPAHPRVVDGRPVVFQLVPERERAWHAGLSEWQGATELNGVSIGIENVNRGPIDTPQGRTWAPYPPEQVDAIVRLAKDIAERYGIPPTRVVGHSDIAPQRKTDPGPRFPWHTLALAGVGAWPDDATVAACLAGRPPDAPVDVRTLQQKLARYGYEVAKDGLLDERTRRVFAAFQMHFRPSDYAGNPDAQTEAIAGALLVKYFHEDKAQACDPGPVPVPVSGQGASPASAASASPAVSAASAASAASAESRAPLTTGAPARQ